MSSRGVKGRRERGRREIEARRKIRLTNLLGWVLIILIGGPRHDRNKSIKGKY